MFHRTKFGSYYQEPAVFACGQERAGLRHSPQFYLLVHAAYLRVAQGTSSYTMPDV